MKRVDLSRSAQEYLALRRALGFQLRHETWFLPDFIAFLAAQGSSVITTELALRWAEQPVGTSARWRAHRLSSIRCFAKHHRAFDPRTEVPPVDVIPCGAFRLLPYIYADADIAALMQESRRLRQPLQAATHSTILGLLAATGMRVGEALALDDDDVDWQRSVLTIRHAKFDKCRYVPVHASALAALRAYVAERDRLVHGRRTRSFFVSARGSRVRHQNFHHVFLRLVRVSGVGAGTARRPRLHDLRHTFAVNTVCEWYRRGFDAERLLPSLSTYLGHVSPSRTYWYLTATPELLALAGKRLERSWEVRS